MNAVSPLQEKIAALPQYPGVYQFFDADRKLLYIGKATHLRSRVQSYFRSSTNLSEAKKKMVSRITDCEIILVDTPDEALLLETTLIKRHKPPFNVVMKDDKNFQYIHITSDLFPQIRTTRKLPIALRQQGTFFGPYTSGKAVASTLRLLKSLFHYCHTPPIEKNGVLQYPKRPCLDFHLGKCIGPCAKAVSQKEYAKMISQIEQFLYGKYDTIRLDIEQKMFLASEKKQFELAARYRDQYKAIEHLMAEQKVISAKQQNADYISLARERKYAAVNIFMVRNGILVHQQHCFLQHTQDQTDEEIVAAFTEQYYAHVQHPVKNIYTSTESRRGIHRKMLDMGIVNATEALKKQMQEIEKKDHGAIDALTRLGHALDKTPKELERIEIYDISNFQGSYSVGSMVVFEKGLPAPKQYRKFRIKTVQGPNDFASLKEVLQRRLMHLPEKHRGKKKEWPRPDLIIIDGGKGQLQSVVSVLEMMDVTIPIISLAKREEEIFLPYTKEPILLEKESPEYHLMQRMRDEAHRFAIGFYRKTHLQDLV